MKKEFPIFKSLKILVVAAFLSALSIILGKYLAIPIGNVMRFSFENLPIIFAGMVFGPIVGALVGTVADLIGCVLVGYTINPIVTVGAAAIGAVSGGAFPLLRKMKLGNTWDMVVSVAIAHAVGSVVIKTFGLAAFYSMPFFVLMLWRLLNYVIVGALECLLITVLLKNKSVVVHIKSLGGARFL